MTMTTPQTATSTAGRWTRLRDDIRERRAALAAYRALERELATFTTPADVSDLLAAVDRHDTPDAEAIRTMLADNLRAHHRGVRFSA